jgi:hypothetical protein
MRYPASSLRLLGEFFFRTEKAMKRKIPINNDCYLALLPKISNHKSPEPMKECHIVAVELTGEKV